MPARGPALASPILPAVLGLDQSSARRRLLWVLALAGALAVYAPHLGNGYVWDDHPYMESNPALSGEDSWGTALGSDVWYAVAGTTGTPLLQYYRPAFVAVMRLLWAAGDGTPFPFHLASLVLHIANATLALVLLPRLGVSRGVALAAAALFLVHPLSGEPVYWAQTICEQTVQASALAALLATARAREAAPAHRLGWRVAAVLACALAVFSKETGAMVPLLVTAEALHAPRAEWAARLRLAWPAWLPLPAYLAVRAAVLDPVAGAGWGGDLLRRIGRAGEVLGWDLRRLLFPLPLSPMHALAEPGAASTVLGLAVLAGLAAVLAVVARFRPRDLFWAAWVLGPLAPPLAQIFVSRGMPFAVAERYLFLSLVPALVLQARAVACLVRRVAPARAPTALAAAAVVAFVVAAAFTAPYGKAFADDDAYFARTRAVYPVDPVALLHQGRRALERGDAGEALPLLEASLRRTPRPISQLLVGVALRALGRTDEALVAYGRALQMDGAFVQARMARADLLRDLGRVDEAGADYARAVESSPRNSDARLALGTYRYLRGDVAGAVEHWRAGLDARPDSCELMFNLGMGYTALGRSGSARAPLSRLLSECTAGLEAQRAQARDWLRRGAGPGAPAPR